MLCPGSAPSRFISCISSFSWFLFSLKTLVPSPRLAKPYALPWLCPQPLYFVYFVFFVVSLFPQDPGSIAAIGQALCSALALPPAALFRVFRLFRGFSFPARHRFRRRDW